MEDIARGVEARKEPPMTGNDIIVGMTEALEHSAGLKNGTRTRMVRVPDQIDVKVIREKMGYFSSGICAPLRILPI